VAHAQAVKAILTTAMQRIFAPKYYPTTKGARQKAGATNKGRTDATRAKVFSATACAEAGRIFLFFERPPGGAPPTPGLLPVDDGFTGDLAVQLSWRCHALRATAHIDRKDVELSRLERVSPTGALPLGL